MILNVYSGCDSNLLTTDCTPPVHSDQECHAIMKQASRWLAFVGKFAASALFALVYTYSGELYPTCVRASALGLCSAGGRIGGAISPLVFGIDDKLPWFSNTFFGIASILASITTLFLPETYGKPLTQTIDEAEESYYKKRVKSDILLGTEGNTTRLLCNNVIKISGSSITNPLLKLRSIKPERTCLN